MAFNPDEYLAKYDRPSSGGFDPDAYLAKYDTTAAQPSLAESAVSAIQPEVQGPPTNNEGFLSRLARGTRQAFFPKNMAEVKSALNPNLGQFGVSKILEEEGKRVGASVRNIGEKTGDFYADTLGRKHPYLAATVGTAVGLPLEVASDSLTPSAMQQNIGAEGASQVLPGVISAANRSIGNGASKLSELLTGTKAKNFQRVMEDPGIYGKYLVPEKLGGDMSARTAGKRLGKAEKVFEGASVSPQGDLLPGTIPQGGQGLPSGSPLPSPEVQKVAQAAFPDPLSYKPSITGDKEFINAKFDAADVVNRYATKRGVKPTPEFAKNLYQEMHDNLHSITFGKTPEERVAIAKKLASDYPNLGEDFAAMRKKVLIDSQPGYFESILRVKEKSNPLGKFASQDNPFSSNAEQAKKYFDLARAGEKLTPKQMLEAYQASSDYLQTVPRQDRRYVDMLNFKNALQDALKRLSPEYEKATADFARAATGRATTNILPRTQTGKVSQGRVGFNAMLTGGASLAGLPAALAAFTVSSPIAHGAAHAALGTANKVLTNPFLARLAAQAALQLKRRQGRK
jgi:hypothetical protein